MSEATSGRARAKRALERLLVIVMGDMARSVAMSLRAQTKRTQK